MTLFCPSRGTSLSTSPASYYAGTSNPYNLAQFCSSTTVSSDKERNDLSWFSPPLTALHHQQQKELQRISNSKTIKNSSNNSSRRTSQTASNNNDELCFQLDDFCHSNPDLTTTARDKNTSSTKNPSKFVNIRSILKKSQSADSAVRKTIDVELLRRTLDDSTLELDDCNDETHLTKTVSFADDKNKKLVEIRMFATQSFLISQSPDFKGKRFYSMQQESNRNISNMVSKAWKPDLSLCFTEPSLLPGFEERLSGRIVCLEKCGTRNRLITGIVLVRNIEFEKSVFIRYSINKWKTYSDTEAFFLATVQDGSRDRFTYTLTLPTSAQEIEFAICFKTPTQEHWDNNDNQNYRVADAQRPQSAA